MSASGPGAGAVTSGLAEAAAVDEAEAVALDGSGLPAPGVLTGAAPGGLAGGRAMADVVDSSVTAVSFRCSRVVASRTFTSNLQ